MKHLTVWISISVFLRSEAIQEFIQVSKDTSVDMGDDILMPCLIQNKVGECRWEKDGTPVGMYEDKYEWAGNVVSGDCSIRIIEASAEYDAGVWQCQVTASDFTQKDTLISIGAFLSVRTPPKSMVLLVNNVKVSSNAVFNRKAGELLDLVCETKGGNPSPSLVWSVNNVNSTSGSRVMIRSEGEYKITSSRIFLPISKEDNLSEIKCIAVHPALLVAMHSKVTLNVLYPPKVKTYIRKDNVVSEGESVTLTCDVDSNPPASISWTKLGTRNSFISSDRILNLPVVSRSDAGTYQCQGENDQGLSQPSSQIIDVQYHPNLAKVSPLKADVKAGDQLTLNCYAESYPRADYTWLQQLPSGEILIRGYESSLVIQNIGFQHSGEFVCKAKNVIKKVKKEVKSDRISISVKGPPHIQEFKVADEVIVKAGDNVDISIPFCSNPPPSLNWIVGLPGLDENMISLSSGTRFGRFTAEIEREDGAGHCYQAILRIMGAHPADSNVYILEIENIEGGVKKHLSILVIDDSPKIEFLIAIIVGGILTILLLTLVILYTVKANACTGSKKCKSEAGSNHTDLESCHSNLSNSAGKKAIPPDATYGSSTSECSEATPNSNSRPDLLNLYSEILSPFSASEKVKRREFKSQGVDCQLKSSIYSQSESSEDSL